MTTAQTGFARKLGYLLALLLMSLSAGAFANDDATPKVYGKTIGNWGYSWWEWVLNLPVENNPLFVEGDMDCSVGQTGKVWFLAGNFGGVSDRTCTISKGKALFVPILNVIKWTPIDMSVPEDCGNTPGMKKQAIITECRNVASADHDTATKVFCELDGKPCHYRMQVVRAQSSAKPFMVNSGTIVTDAFGYLPGLREVSVSDGYWVMIDPLSPGQHTLRVASRYGQPVNLFDLDVTYHLTVSASE